MAPNIPLLPRPVYETSLSPMIQNDSGSHGSLPVFSPYTKITEGRTDKQKHGTDSQKMTDPLLKTTPVTNQPKRQGTQEQGNQVYFTTTLEGEQHKGDETQEVNPEGQKLTKKEAKMEKFVIKSDTSPKGDISEEDLNYGDDSRELIPEILNMLSVLHRRGYVSPTNLAEAFPDLHRGHFLPKNDAVIPKNDPVVPKNDAVGSSANVHDTFDFNLTPKTDDTYSHRPSPSTFDNDVIYTNPTSDKSPSPVSTTYNPSQKPLPRGNTNKNTNTPSSMTIHRHTSSGRKSSTAPSAATSPASTNEQPPPSLLLREILIEDETQATNPGHIQEELADFSNLFHHEKTVDELAKGGRNVEVKEGFLLSGEGATAVVLGGMCSLILMLIVFLFLLKKWRRDNNPKGKKEHLEEDKFEFHKSHFGPDLNIPGFTHLPIIQSLINHLHHSPSKTDLLPSPFVDLEENVNNSQLGRLWFSVRYDDEKADLHVNILHARYPNGRGVTSNTGELWVEGLILSPMNTVIATSKTTTRRATPSPVFNHSFLFLLQKDDVKKYILKLKLHDNHPKNGTATVGTIIFPLASIDLSSDEIHCRDLI